MWNCAAQRNYAPSASVVVVVLSLKLSSQRKHFMCCGECEMVGLTFFFFSRSDTQDTTKMKKKCFRIRIQTPIENLCRLFEWVLWCPCVGLTTWSKILPPLLDGWNGLLLKFTKSRMSVFLLPFVRFCFRMFFSSSRWCNARPAISMIKNALNLCSMYQKLLDCVESTYTTRTYLGN